MCEPVNCICKGLTQIPCVKIQNVTMLDILDYRDGCYRNVRLPLPPQLERLSIQNIGINDNTTLLNVTIPDAPDKVVKACFQPNNKLTYLDLSTAGVNGMVQFASNLSLSGLRNLKFCNLQGHGMLLTPHHRFFSDTPMLKVLLLGGNRVDLNFWEDLDFLHTPSLESLDLERCAMHTIPEESFSGLQNLRYLNLSDNGIGTINIVLSRHLRMLDLSKNRIGSLSRVMTDNLDNIADVTLDLSQNPLRCFCDELRFVKWLKSTKVGFKNKHSTFCTHPRLSQVHPWEVDTEELYLICINFTAIISAISTALGVTAMIGAIAVLYKRRWRIRFWIHVAKESWRRKYSPGSNGYQRLRNFKYDAFVAYSSHGEERAWVHMTLREKLEDEHGLKLCMYHRDFMVGRDLADTMKSR